MPVYYNQTVRASAYDNPINATHQGHRDGRSVRPNSLDAACTNGLLEREVVLSILNQTLTWPTYQQFVVDD
jgi:hypothetical protein